MFHLLQLQLFWRVKRMANEKSIGHQFPDKRVEDLIIERSRLVRSDWFELLVSGTPSERVHAALLLSISGEDEGRLATRMMLLTEKSRYVQMCLASVMVGWKDDDIFEVFLRSDETHPYVLFAILQALKIQRRAFDTESFMFLLDHPSPFVRLAFLDYLSRMGISLVDTNRHTALIRSSIGKGKFTSDEGSPSPVFRDRRRFLQKLHHIEKRLAG